jgi:predicted acyltransferase
MSASAAAPAPAPPAVTVLPGRLVSIDVYRGFVMLLLLAEALRSCDVAAALPGSAFWAFFCHHQSHVPWVGASLHDLIQPSFSFLVGTALAFSVASRTAAGQSRGSLIRHALWRAVVLVLLGIWLRSVGRPQTYFTFEDTLTQIASATFSWSCSPSARCASSGWPSRSSSRATGPPSPGTRGPGADFDYVAVGVPRGLAPSPLRVRLALEQEQQPGLGLRRVVPESLPREHPFVFNGGGYATLSFIPTLGTMILGLLAGGHLRGDRAPARAHPLAGRRRTHRRRLGWLLGALGICPVVKRIWTRASTLWSGGVCFMIWPARTTSSTLLGHRRWAFPLVVIGMNSIAAYCIYELTARFIAASLRTHLGEGHVPGGGGSVPAVRAGPGRGPGDVADPLLDVPAADLPADLISSGTGWSRCIRRLRHCARARC